MTAPTARPSPALKPAYEQFLARKAIRFEGRGIPHNQDALNEMLFPFQREIVHRALTKGRFAIFADCGLGKTAMQLEWADKVSGHTEKPVLILTPLAVGKQTEREGAKFHIRASVCATADEVSEAICITNYEKLHHFDPSLFGGIVLDESSILKSFDGVTRKRITDFAEGIQYRLACTATPAPNDLIELTNHAEFLGVMSGKEIIALFFKQDGNTTHQWRLKHHAHNGFWKWLSTWAVAIRSPADLGFDGSAFVLPRLRMHEHILPSPPPEDSFFQGECVTLIDRRNARRRSLPERVRVTAELVNASTEEWIVWCDLNAEADALREAIPDAIEIRGADSNDKKESALLGFAEGKMRVLITKPTIAGHGMNYQHCRNVAFVGLSDSWEQYYQAIRRCWRFGQTRDVHCHLVISEAEGAVARNIERKESQAADMFANLTKHMGRNLELTGRQEMEYETDVAEGGDWKLYLGDCVERIDEIESDSVGLAIFSPPFPGMYAYTNSARDMGNVRNIPEMIEQFGFLADKMLRVSMPGRSCCIHLTQAVAFKGVDGYIGLKDFRGETIKVMERCGWVYYGEVCIDKDPQIKAIRTKDAGLLFKSLANDSSRMHMALSDYLLQFRKPGENPIPIRAGTSERYDNEGWITSDEWIEWAAPVWYRQTKDYPGGIRETDVLNVACARDEKDERHLCPLQLGVIERAVKLWSAPGDLVLSPFAGIGSEGYEAVRLNRRFVGIELKRSYYDTAIKNLKRAEQMRGMQEADLFAALDCEAAS